VTGEIRIYVEGGGDHKDQKRTLRTAFDAFLEPVKTLARQKRIKWSLMPSGGRTTAHDDFITAMRVFPEATVILLVDSEGEVRNSPKDYLTRKETGWDLSGAAEENIHLMVQTMEAWFMADKDVLVKVFGPKFNLNNLPQRANVEGIPKSDLKNKLKRMTKAINKRNEYNEIFHGSLILEMIDPSKVRNCAPHCDRLFSYLEGIIEMA
jgi:hypothetical protein